ncbi:YdcH family protein [Hwanghaeella sp.]|uniref:YdcH family protein n=1 Tax=Hwanghaeella sp. TaxID=2605943 RepID=UPI003CCB9289
MTHTPHDIAEEFPEHADRIHALKAENAHFAKLCDTHHRINREIHRGEENIEPMDDMHLEELKKQRLALLDEIVTFLD